MIVGGVVTSAILITSATVMRGMTVSNAMDMAVQLEPTLGSLAQPFMAIGLIAAGVSSAVCTPLGVSYVFAGLFGWETNRSDKRYTITNTAVLVTGIVLAAIGWDPLALIVAAQAVNGIVLPVSVGVVLYLTSRKKIMGVYKNNALENVLGVAVFGISLVIGINSLVSLF
jgi:Mn2+/Fe2+ NRAMP family transporter